MSKTGLKALTLVISIILSVFKTDINVLNNTNKRALVLLSRTVISVIVLAALYVNIKLWYFSYVYYQLTIANVVGLPM
jgi:magnesium-transporting ATPase (P-type)